MSEVQLTFGFESRSAKALDSQLNALGLEINDFQKYARKLGNYVRTLAVKNIRGQRTVEGSAFPPRAKERSRHRAKRRLLQGLADPSDGGRKLSVVSKAQEGGGVAVTYKPGLTAEIAARQQYGTGSFKMNASIAKHEKKGKEPKFNAPCTRSQAKALIAEGYKLAVPEKGGGRGPGRNKKLKSVSAMWLEKHFSIGQAGLILRILKTGKLKGKKDWKSGIPPRPFLGVTTNQAEEITTKLAAAIAKAAEKAK